MLDLLKGRQPWIPVKVDPGELLAKRKTYDADLSDVEGQYQAGRALEAAVAGGHNILMFYVV